MSGNAFLKAVCRHLPLLRGPLLINNTICLVLSVLSFSAIYLPQLIFIAISFLISLFDFLRYSIKKRASRQSRSDIDQDIHAPGFVVAVDGVLSVLLLAIWIIGVVAFSSWRPKTAIIATFGAFIAWSFHFISFSTRMYLWMKLRPRAISRCPNCDRDLGIPTSLTNAPDFQHQNELPPQPREPDAQSGTSPNEYDDLDSDCLILRYSEDKS